MLGLLGGRAVGLLAAIGLILFFLGGGSPPHPDSRVLQHRIPRDVPSALDCLRPGTAVDLAETVDTSINTRSRVRRCVGATRAQSA